MGSGGSRLGLVLGFEPFAGLPTNPAQEVLAHLDGTSEAGVRVVARTMPVSLARLPGFLGNVLEEHRPAFVLGLGLAAGSAVVRAETFAINLARFGVPDNDGAVPDGVRFAPDGPDGRMASWDAGAVVSAILDEGLPAQVSHHAGTHCCNLMLYTVAGLLQGTAPAVPCGFLHLPYLPDQVAAILRQGPPRPSGPGDLPSMALPDQVRAVRASVRVMARHAAAAGATIA